MTPNFPIVSAASAALLGLLATLLAVRVITTRVRLNVNAGDGGHAELAQAIRAHSNLVEHAPLALLLLAFAEAAGAWRGAVIALGLALIVARLASAWGLSHSLGVSSGRQSGAGLTLLVTVLASLLVLYRSALIL
jgi:uncharacterized membrane protein YecN with MAPEG domain